MMKIFDWFDKLCDKNSPISSKSFALALSAIGGFLVVLCICYILVFDVTKDGVINTNLWELGVFLCSVGVFMGGAGYTKVLAEKYGEKH